MAEEVTAEQVTFVNQNTKSCKVFLFGPNKNRVRLANVLAAFQASQAFLPGDNLLEANDEGFSMHTFAAGATYNLTTIVPQGDLSSVIVRAVAEGFSTFTPVIDGMKSMLLERLSATRAASRINREDLGSLRTALGILGPTPECDASSSTYPLATLLGNETSAGAETFCDDRYEVQQEEQYIKVLKACIPENANRARKLEWKSATGRKLQKTFEGVEFPVSASNDVVLCVRRYSEMFELGALLGVELKKKLTWQGLRQAEVDFYLWSEQSIFPYVQLITDMEHGGVAIYCREGRDVRILPLESMEGVRRFLKEFGNSLPPDLGQDDSTSGRLVCPDSLSAPARKKFKSSDLGVNSTGQQQDTSQAAGQVALWSMAARWKNNLHDVGNMRDLDDFGDFGDDVLVHG
ncbi:hypothetical protein M758_9G019700 [Ceratodon purpureus]|nr:hypothetical protein M758_9G019700 [Ceratodon purpureus]